METKGSNNQSQPACGIVLTNLEFNSLLAKGFEQKVLSYIVTQTSDSMAIELHCHVSIGSPVWTNQTLALRESHSCFNVTRRLL